MTDAPAATPVPRKTSFKPANNAVATIRETASNAVDGARQAARDLAGKTTAGIDANPIVVLAGGIALGVLAGAFVPRTAQEARVLGPVGKRLSDTARGAVEAAKHNAKSELDVLGLTRNAVRDQVGKLLGDLVKTLATVGTAALAAAKTATPAAAPPPKRSLAKKAKPQP